MSNIARIQSKLVATQNCHPSAVQTLIAEALDALDEFARAQIGQQPPLVLTGYQLRDALEFVAPDDIDEQLEQSVCIAVRDNVNDEEGEKVLPAGLFVWLEEYPDEGLLPLDGEPVVKSRRPQAEAALAEADRRAGAAERELASCRDDLTRLNRVRDQMKAQWGADRYTSFDVVWAEALKLKQQAEATDGWQQYAKDGETAQQCIERHRGECDATMNLLSTARAELGRAYRCIQAMHNGLTAIQADFPGNGYHTPIIAAAKRFVWEGAIDGSDYFIGKHVDVLRAALALPNEVSHG